eukprot:151703_1
MSSNSRNLNNINHDSVQYPMPVRPQKSPLNNLFVMLNEPNVPNYTEPGRGSQQTIKTTQRKPDIHKSSSIATSFNIIKGIMGVSLLALPWAIANVGLVPSIISISISFIFSYICWIFLSLLCAKYDVYCYRDIGLITFGPRCAIGLDILLFVFLTLCCIVYVVFVSLFLIEGLAQLNINVDSELSFSNLYQITSFEQFMCTKFGIITIVIYLILFPLSLLDHLDSLKYSSFVGIIGCMYGIGLVAYTYFDTGEHLPNTVFSVNYHTQSHDNTKVFWFWMSSLPVFLASFNTHFNCPALFGELRDRSTRKYVKISSISFILVLIVNGLIGMFGYFTFGTNLDENILHSLPNGLVAGIARFILLSTIIGTYPLLFWNIKVSIDNMVLYQNVTDAYRTKIKKIPRKYTCLCSKVFIYFVVTSMIWAISIVAVDVVAMINFAQSLLGNVIVFVLPAMFYLEMLKDKSNRENMVKIFFLTMLCYIVLLFGLLSIILGCAASIMFWVGYIE